MKRKTFLIESSIWLHLCSLQKHVCSFFLVVQKYYCSSSSSSSIATWTQIMSMDFIWLYLCVCLNHNKEKIYSHLFSLQCFTFCISNLVLVINGWGVFVVFCCVNTNSMMELHVTWEPSWRTLYWQLDFCLRNNLRSTPGQSEYMSNFTVSSD